jgi:hypothetical protein
MDYSPNMNQRFNVGIIQKGLLKNPNIIKLLSGQLSKARM